MCCCRTCCGSSSWTFSLRSRSRTCEFPSASRHASSRGSTMFRSWYRACRSTASGSMSAHERLRDPLPRPSGPQYWCLIQPFPASSRCMWLYLTHSVSMACFHSTQLRLISHDLSDSSHRRKAGRLLTFKETVYRSMLQNGGKSQDFRGQIHLKLRFIH